MNRLVQWCVVSSWLLTAVTVGAQDQKPASSAEADSAVRDRATQVFDEGVRFEKSGDWEKAYASYVVAFRLRRHYAIAANLGAAEMHLRKYRDAAEHLSFALRRVSKEPSLAQQRAALENNLSEVKKHVGSLTVQADTPGADVLIDGKSVGRTPLDAAIFVEPGTRTAEVRLGDKRSDVRTIEVEAGSSKDVTVALDRPSISGSSTAPNSPRVIDSSSGTSASPPNIETPRTRSVAPAVVAGSLTAVGLTIGIAFFAKASSKEDDRQQLLAQLPGTSPCGTGSEHPAECSEISRLAEDRTTARNIGTVGFVAAGVSAAATVYFVWLRPRSGSVSLVPSISSQHATVDLRTTF